MNSLDVLLLLPLVILAGTGFQRGFVREALSVLITVVALVLAINRWTLASGLMSSFIPAEHPTHPIAAGFIIFLVIMVIGTVLASFIGRLVQKSLLSVPNRFAGLVFGLVKGAVMVSLVLQLLLPAEVPDSQARNGSALYPYLLPAAPLVYDGVMAFVPGAQSFADKVGSALEQIKEYDPTSK